jgi:CDP-diacylglycerol--glycerol-3-phosphate 3-phosphatidyltransferase
MAVPTREEYFDRWADLHGGYDPRGSFMVRTWLGLVHLVARPLVALRIPPDAVTLLGLVVAVSAVAVASLGGRWPIAASLLLIVSGLVDNLDGAVAVMTGRTTRWGYVLDSAVDRISDAAYVVAFWALGAPGWWCAAAAFLMLLQEYIRARAGAAGMNEVGVVTVWERPTRVIATAAFLLGAGLYPGAAAEWAAAAALFWIAAGAIGLVQLTIVVRRRLRDDQAAAS